MPGGQKVFTSQECSDGQKHCSHLEHLPLFCFDVVEVLQLTRPTDLRHWQQKTRYPP